MDVSRRAFHDAVFRDEMIRQFDLNAVFRDEMIRQFDLISLVTDN